MDQEEYFDLLMEQQEQMCNVHGRKVDIEKAYLSYFDTEEEK